MSIRSQRGTTAGMSASPRAGFGSSNSFSNMQGAYEAAIIAISRGSGHGGGSGNGGGEWQCILVSLLLCPPVLTSTPLLTAVRKVGRSKGKEIGASWCQCWC
jgi:hypothetical protein